MSKVPHLWLLRINVQAQKAFDDLPDTAKNAVFRRLEQLLSAEDPYNLPFVEMLKDKKFERARKFRAGDYRVLYIVDSRPTVHQGFAYRGVVLVLEIGNRRDVY
jgi:mRNA-degrading endonuclease RelE of RelBE toxin-antitoxin system